MATRFESKEKTKVRKTSSLKLKELEIGILLPNLFALPPGLAFETPKASSLLICVGTYKFEMFIQKLPRRLLSVSLLLRVSLIWLLSHEFLRANIQEILRTCTTWIT